jgi:large subunit ribosomal protein L32e
MAEIEEKVEKKEGEGEGKGKEEREKREKIKEKIKRKRERKPYFFPQNFGRKKRIKERWRKPRGIDSKKRIGIAHLGPVPKIGYRSEREIRGLHPSGRREILISSKKELIERLDEIKRDGLLVRLSSTLGKRSREEIRTIAENEKIAIANL